MPEFQQKRPNLNRERDSGMYNDADEQATQAGEAARQRASDASSKAEESLSNIDDLLAENDSGAVSPGALDTAEQDDTDQSEAAGSEEAGLFRHEGAEDATQSGKGASLRGRLLANKRWLWATGGLGGLLVIVLVTFLLLFSSLKLPNLAENIIAYQFTRVTRHYGQAARKITDRAYAKKAAAETKDSRTRRLANNLRDRAATNIKRIPGVTKYLDMGSGLNDRLNPGQVQRNLKSIGLETGVDGQGRPRLTISKDLAKQLGINEQSFLYEQPKGVGRFIPGYRSYLKIQASQDISSKLQAALNTSYERGLRLNDVSTITRVKVMNDILKELGISRSGFIIAKFKGLNPDSAFGEAQKQAAQATEPKEPVPAARTAPIAEGAEGADKEQQAAQARAKADTSGKLAAQLAETGDAVDTAAAKTIQGTLVESTLQKISNFASGASFQAAFIACVFVDAATTNGSIDNGNQSNQRNFVLLSSVAAQQKRGPTSNDQVGAFDAGISAMNAKAGNETEDSIPIRRAMGDKVDTSSELAAQSGPLGLQWAKDSIDNDAIWSLMETVEPGCSTLTNPYVQGAIAAGTIASYFTGAGEAKAVTDEGAKVASEGFLKSFTGKITTKFTEKISSPLKQGAKTLKNAPIKTLRGSFAKNKKLFGGLVLSTGAVVGSQLLGALVGAQHASAVTHSGYTSGNTWINEADAGGNATANEQCQKMQFCRPLTRSEVCDSNEADMAYRQQSFESQGNFQRYIATSNTQSLFTKTVMTVGSEFDGPVNKPLLKFSTMVTKPSTFLGSILGVFGHRAYAMDTSNCDSDTADYGNVQFGWSNDERDLIEADPSYGPDENLAILADPRNIDAVESLANKYARCFGYKVDENNDLVPDSSGTIGNLLGVQGVDLGAEPAILRDEHGNVLASRGLCAPNNLSFDTADPDYRGKDDSLDTNKANDLVFRWRLANRYNTTKEQLLSYQSAPAQGTQ